MSQTVTNTNRRFRQPLWPGAMAVVSFALLARAAGLVKEMALARSLGISTLVDQFVFAFTLATWPAAILASVLTISLTPLLARREAKDAASDKAFVQQLMGASLALAALAAVFVWCLHQGLAPAAPQSNAFAGMAALLAAISLPVATLTVLSMAFGRNTATLFEGVPSLVLAALFLLGLGEPLWLLLLGPLLGAWLQITLLTRDHRQDMGELRLAWPQAHPHWRRLASGFGYALAGQGILSVAPLIEFALAAHLSEGSASSLGYASRAAGIVSGILVLVINRVAIGHFSRKEGDDGWRRIVCLSLVVASALSAGLWLGSDVIVALLFQGGQFDAQTTQVVSQVLTWLAPHLVPFVGTVVLCAHLAARSAFKHIFIACALCFAARAAWAGLGTLGAFGMMDFGLGALATAPVVGYGLEFAYLLWISLRLERR